MDTSNMQFKTAAARRGGKPITLTIEHYVVQPVPEDWDPDKEGEWESEGETIVETVMVDPLVDTVRVGAAFGGFGALIKSFTGADSVTADEDKLKALDVHLPRAREAMRNLLIPTHRARWDRVKEGVDVTTLGQLVQFITSELSGLDPTQPKSSPDGSNETSDNSTDGPQPEA